MLTPSLDPHLHRRSANSSAILPSLATLARTSQRRYGMESLVRKACVQATIRRTTQVYSSFEYSSRTYTRRISIQQSKCTLLPWLPLRWRRLDTRCLYKRARSAVAKSRSRKRIKTQQSAETTQSHELSITFQAALHGRNRMETWRQGRLQADHA